MQAKTWTQAGGVATALVLMGTTHAHAGIMPGFLLGSGFGRYEFTTANPNNFTQGSASSVVETASFTVSGTGSTGGGLGNVTMDGTFSSGNNSWAISSRLSVTLFPGASGFAWGESSVQFFVDTPLVITITDSSFGQNSTGSSQALVRLSQVGSSTPIPTGSTIQPGAYLWETRSLSTTPGVREFARLTMQPVPSPGAGVALCMGAVLASRRRRR